MSHKRLRYVLAPACGRGPVQGRPERCRTGPRPCGAREELRPPNALHHGDPGELVASQHRCEQVHNDGVDTRPPAAGQGRSDRVGLDRADVVLDSQRGGDAGPLHVVVVVVDDDNPLQAAERPPPTPRPPHLAARVPAWESTGAPSLVVVHS